MTIGLVINELVTNAVKHSAPSGQDRPVTVSLETTQGGRHCIIVRNGPAFLPSGFDLTNTGSLGFGLELILALLPNGTSTLNIWQETDEVVAKLELKQ